jgi:hypothetical protein
MPLTYPQEFQATPLTTGAVKVVLLSLDHDLRDGRGNFLLSFSQLGLTIACLFGFFFSTDLTLSRGIARGCLPTPQWPGNAATQHTSIGEEQSWRSETKGV